MLTLLLLVISLLAFGQSDSQSLEVEIKYWKSIAESNDTVAYRDYLPFDLFGIIETVGVLNGKVKFRADCKEYVLYKLDYDDLYRSICHEDYKNKYLLITLKGCSSKYIIFTFIASLIGAILIFYLIVLILSYIRRGVPEYGFKNRAYDALMYLIGDNGEKICVEDIKIEKETKTITSKKDGKEI